MPKKSILVLLLLGTKVTSVWAQCAMCKTGLQAAEAVGLTQGFYYAILLMVSLPFLLVVGIINLIVKQERLRRAQEEPPLP